MSPSYLIHQASLGLAFQLPSLILQPVPTLFHFPPIIPQLPIVTSHPQSFSLLNFSPSSVHRQVISIPPAVDICRLSPSLSRTTTQDPCWIDSTGLLSVQATTTPKSNHDHAQSCLLKYSLNACFFYIIKNATKHADSRPVAQQLLHAVITPYLCKHVTKHLRTYPGQARAVPPREALHPPPPSTLHLRF